MKMSYEEFVTRAMGQERAELILGMDEMLKRVPSNFPEFDAVKAREFKKCAARVVNLRQRMLRADNRQIPTMCQLANALRKLKQFYD